LCPAVRVVRGEAVVVHHAQVNRDGRWNRSVAGRAAARAREGSARCPRAEGGAGKRGAAPLELARGVVRDEEGARGGEGVPEAAEELRADGGGHEGATELLEAAIRFRQRDLGAGRRRTERETRDIRVRQVIYFSRLAFIL
jgi:hypothetical protein